MNNTTLSSSIVFFKRYSIDSVIKLRQLFTKHIPTDTPVLVINYEYPNLSASIRKASIGRSPD